MNVPADGPVMKKMTTNWEPSCEKIIPIPSQGILKGEVAMYLLLKDGGALPVPVRHSLQVSHFVSR